MSKITNFIKKETVLCIAVLLAVLSVFMVHPDKGYVEYINFRTLAMLFCLMIVMASFISYKYVASAKGSSKGKYIRYFTMINISFLAALLFLYFVISNL